MRWFGGILCALSLGRAVAAPGISFPVVDPTAAERKLLNYRAASELRIESVDVRPGYDLIYADLSFVDPYSGDAIDTRIEFYRSRTAGDRPMVLVLPPFRGKTPVDQGFAEFFAENGLHAAEVLIDDDEYQRDQPLDYVNRFFVRNVVNLRLLLDQFSVRPEFRVDTDRTLALGISLGGIRASILFGLEPRVRAAVLVVAGAELASLMSHSILSPIQAWRDHNLFPDKHGLPQDEEESLVDDVEVFERALHDVVEVEPGRYAANRRPEEVFIIRSLGDSYVPTRNQDALLAAFSSRGATPRLLETGRITGGHYPTILYAYWQREEILEFLRGRLAKAQRRPAE